MQPMMVDIMQSMTTDLLTDGGGVAANVLFIGGNVLPTSGADAFVWLHLRAKYGAANVTYLQASAGVTADANGRTVVVISSTPSSNDIRGKWNGSAVGIMNWEEAVMKIASGDFQFATDTAKPSNVTQIRVVDDAHPIMVQAGFVNGLQTVMASGEQNCPQGTIAGGVAVLAELPTDAACKTVAVGEQGGLGIDLVPFPARRGMFPITDSSFDNLDVDGLALFDAMLDWLSGSI
jgi:hypothetical protein